ncbi:MAG: hypothetical protein H7210_02070 [Pyrinomonadaceae bacterium]|nr:hypothetical protein [Phycisphaerales bacterium]
MKIPFVRIGALLLGLTASTGPCLARQSVHDILIRLAPDYGPGNTASHPSVIYRAFGEVNFLDTYGSSPFTPCIEDQYGVCGPPGGTYPEPIGDRLGYDTAGLFDVDGDGYNDWAETWYFAEPSRPNFDRVVAGNAVVLPPYATFPPYTPQSIGVDQAATPEGLLALAGPKERVGVCRVFSGRTKAQIGQDIWGNSDNASLAHEIAAIKDIDGDGRAELILSSNATDGKRGSLNVYAFSGKYNIPSSAPGERWVCIMRIVGSTTVSEIGYETEDQLIDVNDDDQPDIIFSSLWWRQSEPVCNGTPGNPDDLDRNHTRGAAWVFLTPKKALFKNIQDSATWPPSYLAGSDDWLPTTHPASPVKAPLVMIAEEHYNLCVMNPVVDSVYDPDECWPPSSSTTYPTLGVLSDLAATGDIDGDGKMDLVANAGYRKDRPEETQLRTRGLYFFLSNNGFDKDWEVPCPSCSTCVPTDLEDTEHGAVPKFTVIDGTIQPDPLFRAIVLLPSDADLVIHGDDEWEFDVLGNPQVGLNLDDPTGGPVERANDMALAFSNKCYKHMTVYIVLDPEWGSGPMATLLADWSASTNPDRDLPCPILFNDSNVNHNFWYTHIYTNVITQDEPAIGYRNILGVNNAGDFDGDGDCELSIAGRAGHVEGQAGRGICAIINVAVPSTNPNPPPGETGPLYAPPTLYEVRGEGAANLPPTVCHPNFNDGRSNYQTVQGEPGWDIDGDGRTDVIVRAGFFPRQVKTVFDYNGDELTICMDAYENYFVDGGQDYVVLSPPALPQLVSAAKSSKTCTVVASALVPPTAPYNQFPVVTYHASPGGPVIATAFSTIATRDSTGKTTLKATFAATLPSGLGFLGISTRYHAGLTGAPPWYVAVP